MNENPLKEVNEKLPELKEKFNQVLKESGFPHVQINDLSLSLIPCGPGGQCPQGLNPTPVFNPATGTNDCFCM